jgi:uncharacterized 2Fe-2S/4Fe-4S cluster protein (DUF4445 family)
LPKIEGPTVALTFDGLLLVAAVIILVFVLASTIRSGIEAIRGMSVRGRVKNLEDQMETVNKRLDKGTRKFKAQSDDIGQLLIVNQSMLMHFITGNDHDKLRQTNESLVAYMAARASREREDDIE